jgi:hypothetical protein
VSAGAEPASASAPGPQPPRGLRRTQVLQHPQGVAWLTLGVDNVTPGPILTDDKGTGTASLSRNVGAVAQPGDAFDIHFRVVQEGTTVPVLESDCYRFVVRL